MDCDRPFSVWVRRHHCRACGSIVCYTCSQTRSSLPQFGYGLDPVRVCCVCAAKADRTIHLEQELARLARKLTSQVNHKEHDYPSVFRIVEFASRIRLAKACDDVSEPLLRYAIQVFRIAFMLVYDTLLTALCSWTPDTVSLDHTLEDALHLLRSWKNLENDLPRADLHTFLAKTEALEQHLFQCTVNDDEHSAAQCECASTAIMRGKGLRKVYSMPELSRAQQSFYRHPDPPMDRFTMQQPGQLSPPPSPRSQ